MMRKIKYALAFLWGTLFASSIWYLALFDISLEDSVTAVGLLGLLAAVVIVSSVTAIIIMAMCFFSDHWSDD